MSEKARQTKADSWDKRKDTAERNENYHKVISIVLIVHHLRALYKWWGIKAVGSRLVNVNIYWGFDRLVSICGKSILSGEVYWVRTLFCRV